MEQACGGGGHKHGAHGQNRSFHPTASKSKARQVDSTSADVLSQAQSSATLRTGAIVGLCVSPGLGSQTVEESIICDRDASSLYKRKKTKSESGIDVSIIDVVEWFDSNQIGNVSLMAINAEGGEYPLLDRLIDSGYISKIENLLVQFHDIYQKDAEERMNRIQRELLKTHQPVFQYKFVWERWKRK